MYLIGAAWQQRLLENFLLIFIFACEKIQHITFGTAAIRTKGQSIVRTVLIINPQISVNISHTIVDLHRRRKILGFNTTGQFSEVIYCGSKTTLQKRLFPYYEYKCTNNRGTGQLYFPSKLASGVANKAR